MIKKGMYIKNPMVNAVRSSESTNAVAKGTKPVVETALSGFSPAILRIEESSLSRVFFNKKARIGSSARSIASEMVILSSRSGCSAASLILEKVGAMTTKLSNSEIPTITWLGGTEGEPNACLARENVMTMRVKLVSMTSNAGAIESTVRTNTITMALPPPVFCRSGTLTVMLPPRPSAAAPIEGTVGGTGGAGAAWAELANMTPSSSEKKAAVRSRTERFMSAPVADTGGDVSQFF